MDSILASASSKTDAVLAWLSSKAESGRGSVKDTTEYLKQKTNEALMQPTAEYGVRLLALPAKPNPRPEGQKDDPPVSPTLNWIKLDAVPVQLPDRVVLLVHGLDEPGSVWDDLAPMTQQAGYAVARFDYANDQPCPQSADELASALMDLHRRGVKRVDLVCHSMGGLVARDLLTRPDYYNGSGRGQAMGLATGQALPVVSRLITLGTPNQGSLLAKVRWISESREQFMRWIESDSKDPRALLGFMRDGAGEAGDDLLPGSEYLKELNVRPLPKDVAMTVIIGTLAAPERDGLKEMLEWPSVRKVMGDAELKTIAEYLDSAAKVIGDGVVSVDSAKLDGVSDTVFVQATHRTMVKRPFGEPEVREAIGEAPKTASAIPLILNRLAKE